MTYEQAVYYKLLVLSGHSEELQVFLDKALETEEPINDIVLRLAFSGSDDNKTLSVLNEYISRADDKAIDYDGAVCRMLLSFLRKKHNDNSLSMAEITKLMYEFACNSDRTDNEPWYTMFCMNDYYSGARSGYYDENTFLHQFNALLTYENR